MIARIDASDYLRGLFSEGKMMGALLVEMADHVSHDANPTVIPGLTGDLNVGVLYAFSGVAGGSALVEGFVPPIMLLTDEENIREVIAFPMNSNAQDVLLGSPGEVTEQQLREVHIKLR